MRSLLIVCFIFLYHTVSARYEPNWASLDTRPSPLWYDEAKVGIMIHWGVYSVPSIGTAWFWLYSKTDPRFMEFMKSNYKPDFSYQEFAREFTAELFNATQWALLFQDSGAKYVVITSKHHDGFALWPSTQSFGWNSMDVGPKRDILKDLSSAIRQHTSIKFGLCHSLFEWYNPIYLDDKSHSFQKQNYVDNKLHPELTALVTDYLPDILWVTGGWEAPAKYWKSEEFLAWLFNDSPVRDTVVTSDGWGSDVGQRHGDFYITVHPGTLRRHKWESAFPLEKTRFGQRFDVTLSDFRTSKEVIGVIISTVSYNGNVIVNVGPTKYGTILPIFEERLRDMGSWLKVNGEAIYGSRPWIYEQDSITPSVWYTRKTDPKARTVAVYAMILEYPYDTNEIDLYPLGTSDLFRQTLALDHQTRPIVLLGMSNAEIKWTFNNNVLHIVFPPKNLIDKQGLQFAWTFKIVFNE